jgi:hypothetical protein
MSLLLTSITLLSALPTLLAFHCSPFDFKSAPVASNQKPFDVTLTFKDRSGSGMKKSYQLCKLDKNGKASLQTTIDTVTNNSFEYPGSLPVTLNYTTVVGERWFITSVLADAPCTGNLYAGVMYFDKPTKTITSDEWYNQCDVSCHSNTASSLPSGKKMMVGVTNDLNEPVDYCQVFGKNQVALIEQLKGYLSFKYHETKTQNVFVLRKMSAKGPCKGENLSKPFSYQATVSWLMNDLVKACPLPKK